MAGTGLSTGPGGGYSYGGGGTAATAGNARDYYWVQNYGSNFTNNAALDQPWVGNVFDLGGQANQAVVFPVIDHGPLPWEAIEYTVYLTNTPGSTSLADWTLAVLDSVYLEGWQADGGLLGSIADGFTTVWKLPGNQTFRYVSVAGVGSQAFGGGAANSAANRYRRRNRRRCWADRSRRRSEHGQCPGARLNRLGRPRPDRTRTEPAQEDLSTTSLTRQTPQRRGLSFMVAGIEPF